MSEKDIAKLFGNIPLMRIFGGVVLKIQGNQEEERVFKQLNEPLFLFFKRAP
ncbi:hypothetical protein AGMMS49949_07560 [Alphaproteobacteria bacterium]|nr:hypothetical protein AGMMS49949_07560 [Alphaproteobacteria bacterium]